MKEFAINHNDAGQRLDRFVSKTAPALSASLTQKYIRIKRIKVGNKGSKRDYILREGDFVQMYINDEFFADRPRNPTNDNTSPVAKSDSQTQKNLTSTPLDIIYEDNNILIVNKKAGVLCHSGNSNSSVTLINQIQSYLIGKNEWDAEKEHSFSPALCNRIDRNTSGLVIAAKNAAALRIINEKIRLREIDKYYLAAVNGIPDPPAARLEGYLIKDTAKNISLITQTPLPQSKPAVTDYKTIKTADNMALLECRLITGRSHQIRAQFADIGHPLLGDRKYGGIKDDKAKRGETSEISTARNHGTNRNRPNNRQYQSLCAYKITFAFKSDAGPLAYLSGKTFEITSQNLPDSVLLREH